MGFLFFKDVIEYIDETNAILVHKYNDRPSNEIKKGAKAIIREGQCGVFVKGGQIADVWGPGTHTLNTGNLPILSKIGAFAYGFNSPIKSDFYFVSTKLSTNNKWATKNPIMMRDKDFGVIRLRAFGTFSFRIVDVKIFMREVFGSLRKVFTWDIVDYLSSYIQKFIAKSIQDLNISALDYAYKYQDIGSNIKQQLNLECKNLGIEFADVNVENISLPDDVEKLIDEQSGIGLASKDMSSFAQYQSIRAMRDAAQQKNGLAGVSAGMALGNQVVKNMQQFQSEKKDVVAELKNYKELLDAGVISEEEFNNIKRKLLN